MRKNKTILVIILLLLYVLLFYLYASSYFSNMVIIISQKDVCTEENKKLAEENLKKYMEYKYPNMFYKINYISFSRFKGDYEAIVEETTTDRIFIVQYLNIDKFRSDAYENNSRFTDSNGNLITSYEGAPRTSYK